MCFPGSVVCTLRRNGVCLNPVAGFEANTAVLNLRVDIYICIFLVRFKILCGTYFLYIICVAYVGAIGGDLICI